MLPQFGFTEFLLIAVIALIVVGPKDLPMMMRKLGQFVAKGKSMAREFQSAFDDIARQAELDELRKEIEDLRRDNALTEAVDDLKKTEADINRSVMMQKPKKTGDEPAASENQDMTTPDETPDPEALDVAPDAAAEASAKEAPDPAPKDTKAAKADPPAGKKASTS